MDKLNPSFVGRAAAIMSSIVFSVSALAVALFPDSTVNLFNSWFHGLDLTLLRPTRGCPLPFGQFFYGLFGVVVVSFVMGTLFAAVYNLIRPRAK